MSSVETHDFAEHLKQANSSDAYQLFDRGYKRFFGTRIVRIERHPNDMRRQRQGIDVTVHVAGDHDYRIEEKYRPDRIYPDILLEYVSVDTTGAPGWMEKDLHIDYLAYGFAKLQTIYMLPWPALKLAWEINKEKWQTLYKPVAARNNGYTTWSVAVPIWDVRKAIGDAACIVLEPLTSE